MMQIKSFPFGAVLIMGALFSISSRADDLDSLRSTVRSQICPASVAKYDLVRGSCAAERARLTGISNGLSGNADETYRAFMRCQNAEDEQNKIINQYNAFMNRCEAAEREKKQSERDRHQKIEQEKQQVRHSKNQNEATDKLSDLDRRLQNARAKAETFARNSKNDTQNMMNEATRVNQKYEADQAEIERQRRRQEFERQQMAQRKKEIELAAARRREEILRKYENSNEDWGCMGHYKHGVKDLVNCP